MKSIPVDSLKAGMAFDKPVYIDRNNMLVDAKEAISQSDIDRLKKWNIKEIQTTGIEIQAEIVKNDSKAQNTQEKIDLEKIIKRLKETSRYRETFFEVMQEGEELVHVAYDSITHEKPFQISRIRTLAENIVTILDKGPDSFMYLYYDKRAETVGRHVMAVSVFSIVLAEALQISKPRIIELVFSILLMDIGMMLLPTSIIEKSDKLTDAEKAKVHAHPLQGYQLLTQTAKVKNSIASVALEHHEHFDGSGYPRHIKGTEMSDYTKIAAICDSFAALLESKAYRGPELPYRAMKELLTLGIYRYDPIYLKSFLDRLSIYPIGSIVKLSDNSMGIVAGHVTGKPMRPVILIVRDTEGHRPSDPTFVHLLYHTEKYISQALDPEEALLDLALEITHFTEKL